MKIGSAIFVHLLLCLSPMIYAAPRVTIPTGFFPNRLHPWSNSDDSGSYLNLFNPRESEVRDYARPRYEHLPQFPVYSKAQDGFVPSDITTLDRVYWWKKRFQTPRNGPAVDIPFFDDSVNDISRDSYLTSGVNKRDYTAAQLVNMLKALAKARRQRNIRIAGKGLRFGISK